MTGPQSETEGTKPISVAELLARNGTLGAPAVTRRRRRRRGDGDSVTVAELTGEIPIIRVDDDHSETRNASKATHAPGTNRRVRAAQTAATQLRAELVPEQVAAERVSEKQTNAAYWSEPEPRWPKSPPLTQRQAGPERSAYPRPMRHAEARNDGHGAAGTAQPGAQSGAEDMRPDPVDPYADTPVDVMDSEVREAEPVTGDSAYVRSYLQASEDTLFGGQTLADELARRRSDERAKADGDSPGTGSAGDVLEKDDLDSGPPSAERDSQAQDAHRGPGRFETLWGASLIVLQSILAVAFGAGLFVAFDGLWRWNSIVALVLSVLVILGLVVGVRVVRKTEDIASTLIAVAVGALITLGPLALSLQSG
ncbi:MAG: hypothetical protein WBZ37_16015 [Mycobacterium sp.]